MPDVSRSLHHTFAHLSLSTISIAVAVEFLLAFGCGAIMERKGRSNVVGFVIAFAFSVIGIAIVLWYPSKTKSAAAREKAKAQKITDNGRARRAEMRPPQTDSKACPSCSVPVPKDSDICRVCQHVLEARIAV